MTSVRAYRLRAPASGDPTFALELPRGATILGVNLTVKTTTLYAEVDVEQPTEPRILRAFSQGEPLPERRRFVSTIIAGALDWHLYEIFP